ncbi:hypothetical protein B0G82_4249 [Paraburkholderia sp. BL17N1]|nr:hypothetical protein B0G82_4249 [Paraburkholderia sp. BL17N1]
MSVIFVACKGLRKFNGIVDDQFRSAHFDTDAVEIDENPKWPYFANGLEVGTTYMYEEDCWFSFGRRYPFYENVDKLAVFVGYDYRLPGAGDPGPFRELFCWGKGMVGPVISAKLVSDFDDWDDRARALDDENFYNFYQDMRRMFEFAMKDGCVFLRNM